MAEIEGADTNKIVAVKGLEASKKLDDVKIRLKFKPDEKIDWCSPVFHEFTVLKVELEFQNSKMSSGKLIDPLTPPRDVRVGVIQSDIVKFKAKITPQQCPSSE